MYRHVHFVNTNIFHKAIIEDFLHLGPGSFGEVFSIILIWISKVNL